MRKEILCFGDSNTHGYSPEDGGRYPYEVRWTGMLDGLLGDGYHIIEEGLSGRTAVFDDPIHECMSGIALIEPIMVTHEPIDTLIIMLGTNDTKERFCANARVIAIGIERLIKRAQMVEAWRGKPDIILVCPSPIEAEYYEKDGGWPMGKGCSEKSYELSERLCEVAKRQGCRFLDAGFAPVHPNDNMHLSREGHEKLAKALAEILLK